MNKDNNQNDGRKNDGRSPIALDMVLSLVIPLLDALAAGWLRWRAGPVTPPQDKKDEGINRQPTTGSVDLPVSDVRGGSRAAAAPSNPGPGLQDWQRNPRKAAYHPPDDHE